MRSVFVLIVAILQLASCRKDKTDYTKDYPGRYVVWGRKQIFPSDSITILQVYDTADVVKVDNQTLTFNGQEHQYSKTGSYSGAMFERKETSTYSWIAFDDIYPDSIYCYFSHLDGMGGGYAMDLRGYKLHP